uniref:EB domain-containing protein n=1 Tax=Magallana gigas TaxID=29159 RepID=A0A8W8LJW3_MAGGI
MLSVALLVVFVEKGFRHYKSLAATKSMGDNGFESNSSSKRLTLHLMFIETNFEITFTCVIFTIAFFGVFGNLAAIGIKKEVKKAQSFEFKIHYIMAISHVYIYTIAILVCNSNAQNIEYGNMCLESVSKFWNLDADYRCKFKESQIRNFLQNANTTCPKICKFTMSDLKSNGARDLKIKLLFNNVSNNRVVDACANRSPNQGFRELYINCSSWNEGEYGVYQGNCKDNNGQCDSIYTVCACHCQQGYTMVDNNCENGKIAFNHSCVSYVQCTGTPLATNCSAGQCTCQVGHVTVNNTCYPGYLVLDQPCTYDSQCLGSPNASCVDGKCSCIKGYSAKDSSVCVSMAERQEQKADGNKKSLFAAIIGGLLAGVVIVTVSAILIYKRFCRNNTTRKEPVIHFENHQYDTNGVDDNATPLIETKQENAANKSPHDHSKEAVEYSHIYDETRDALAQDDVYHHLNEEKDQKQDDNNYDHASAAVGHVTNLSEYSLISDFKNDKTVSLTEEQDEYFIIEQSFSTNG